MQQHPHRDECSERRPALYMAMEVSASRWVLAFGVGVGSAVRRRSVAAGDARGLAKELTAARRRFGLAADTPVRSCYEAGRDGFWVHRLLTALGVVNVVVDSSSIEVSRRARRAKTDRLDVERLFRLLCRHWAGERAVWQVVAVPSEAVEDARHQERAVGTLVAERTRWRNRLHGLLATRGLRVRVDARFLARLDAARDWAGAGVPPGLRARLAAAWAQLTHLEAALRRARRAQRAEVRTHPTAAATTAMQLHQVRGISVDTALLLAKEVCSRDLQNRRQVGALSGMVPVPYQSGAAARDQGISRAGLRRVRGRLVEVAWTWLKWQPDSALTQWYQRRFGAAGTRPRRVGIVALARKLLIALWQYTRTGAIPAGVVLRRAA